MIECNSIVPKGRFVMMSLLYDVLTVGCNTSYMEMDFHLSYFNVTLFLQTDRTRADRASDQKQFEGDHDAERPRECHLQRGESVLHMLDLMTLQTDEHVNLGPEENLEK